MTTLVKRPTEVRLDEAMLEELQSRLMVSQLTGISSSPRT